MDRVAVPLAPTLTVAGDAAVGGAQAHRYLAGDGPAGGGLTDTTAVVVVVAGTVRVGRSRLVMNDKMVGSVTVFPALSWPVQVTV